MVDSTKEYVGFTSRFFMRSMRDSPGFFTASRRVTRQLKSAPGLVGWSFSADLLRNEFFTLSAWEDEQSLRTFVAGASHSRTMQRFASRVRRSSIFAQFPVGEKDVPLTWKDAIARQNQADADR